MGFGCGKSSANQPGLEPGQGPWGAALTFDFGLRCHADAAMYRSIAHKIFTLVVGREHDWQGKGEHRWMRE